MESESQQVHGGSLDPKRQEDIQKIGMMVVENFLGMDDPSKKTILRHIERMDRLTVEDVAAVTGVLLQLPWDLEDDFHFYKTMVNFVSDNVSTVKRGGYKALPPGFHK